MTLASSHPTPEQISADIGQLYGSFELDPIGQLGVSDSAHGVIFGEIKGIGEVGVKPFTKLGKAQRELSIYDRVAEMGFDTIEPLEAARGEAASYLISIRRRGLRNLAQEPWSEVQEGERRTADRLAALGLLAVDSAELHDAGITHGDYQAKNVAYDTTTGLYVVNDVERMQIGRSGEYQRVGATEDIAKLGSSLLRKGIFGKSNPDSRVKLLDESLLQPYLDHSNDRSAQAIPDQVIKAWKHKANTSDLY
jgi:hypothetical protein